MSQDKHISILRKKSTLFLLRTLLLTLLMTATAMSATYYLTAAGAGSAQMAGNWNTNPAGGGTAASNFTTNGDIFIIPVGINGVVSGNWAFGSTSAATLTLTINGSLTINNTFAVTLQQKNAGTTVITVASGGSLIFLGTAAATNQLVGTTSGSGSAANNTVTLASGATLKTANLGGIVSGTNGSINSTNLTATLNTGANYEFTGATGQVMTGTPATVNNLTFSGSGTITFLNTVTTVSGNLTMSGTATTTTTANLAVGGNLLIGNGTTFTAAGFNLTVTGTTTVGGGTSGNLTISSATGTKIFTGLVTVAVGSAWTNTAANSPVTFRGGITNNGTFNAGTGVHTFGTNAQALTGTFSIANVMVTGVTLTNNNSLTVGTALSGTGGLTQATNSTLNIGGTSGITTLTATNLGNTVNYNGASQTVHSNNYANLTLSGSGAKTLQTGTTTISGNVTLSGTATTTTVVGLAISGNLLIGNGTTFTAAGFNLTVTGTTTVGGGTSGNLTISSATGTKIFTGLVTVAVGSAWTNTAANSPVTFRGGITNNGTFNAGTGVHTFDTNAQALTGTFSIANVMVTGVTLTNNNTLTVGTAIGGSGGLAQAVNATLNIGGTSGVTLTATASGNTVNYSGTGAQTVNATNYYNLTISGARTGANNISISGAVGVAGTFTNSATFGTGNYVLTGSTIDYNGASQTVIALPVAYNNLTLSGSGTVTMPAAAMTISGNFSMTGTESTTAGGALTIGGSVSLGSGTTFAAGTFSQSVGGNWTNNGGTFTPGTGTVTFNGSATQTIGGSTSSQTFNNVTISGVTVGGSTTALSVSGATSIATSASLEIPSGCTLTFSSGGSVSTQGSGQIILDNGSNYINLTSSAPTLQVKRTITGTEGWRMLAAPDTVLFASMFAGNFVTQGFSGSSFPALQPNLLWWDETSQGTSLQAWRQPSGSTDTVKLGRGYMYYVFNGTQRPDQPVNYNDALPLTMSALGRENPLTTAFDFGVTATTRSASGPPDTTYVDTNFVDYGWNLVGNPTPSTINWDASGWTKTNMDGTIYIWNPADTAGGYKTWNGTTGNFGSGLIAPFQAFWVKANNSSPSLQCTNNAKSTGGNFLGKIVASVSKLASVPGDSIGKKNTSIANSASPAGRASGKKDTSITVSLSVLTLDLSANGLQAQAYLMFSNRGKLSYDPYDAFSLVPLSDKYLIFYSVAGQGQPAMQIQDLPDTGFTEPFTLPLYVGGTVSGQPLSASFSLRWKFDGQLPAGWNVTLMDDAVGKAYTMTTAGELTFHYDTPTDLVPSGNSALEKKSDLASTQRALAIPPWPAVFSVPASRLSKTASASRFRLVISADNGLTGYLPSTPELAQNYPNPFNPTTNIAFSVPAQSRVRIEVFNILGQKVTTVTDQEYPTGKYVVTWNGSRAASGVYFCRMIAGTHKYTMKMVLVR